MKNLLILFLLLVSFKHISAQTKVQSKIIHSYIDAHNQGTDEALINFVNENYNPDYLKKITLDSHIQFYKNIIEEFGKLNYDIYKVIEQNPSHITIYLIKADISTFTSHLEPTEILVLKMDQESNDPEYLSRGLGLGSLLCELKK